ncbi:hypothetical protein [Streptomyces sp. GbtcB6]|uniref:hypothetical protein n=1 Tax=Streptomyces sp. GbtcB6 TaxID=2824751 RepID=UPI001C2FE312|nr:hypothetical protein [Streptomyces sp. GbtcB6]
MTAADEAFARGTESRAKSVPSPRITARQRHHTAYLMRLGGHPEQGHNTDTPPTLTAHTEHDAHLDTHVLGGTMHTRTAACAILLGIAATLTACSGGGSKADPAACKAAMTKQYKDAVAKGGNAPEGTRPKACEGVDDTTVQQFASDIMKDALNSAVSSTPTVAGTPEITAKCRKWIEGELTDDTNSINATAGLKACPGMDNNQLNDAIQAVTDEMLNSATATP